MVKTILLLLGGIETIHANFSVPPISVCTSAFGISRPVCGKSHFLAGRFRDQIDRNGIRTDLRSRQRAGHDLWFVQSGLVTNKMLDFLGG